MDSSSFVQKNLNLASAPVRDRILTYFYNNANVTSKFEPITDESDLDNLRDNRYIVCPKYAGSRICMVFMMIKNVFYAVSFQKNLIHKKTPMILHAVDIRGTKKLYAGTVLEGTFTKMDGCKHYIIDEIYMLSGQNQLTKSKSSRLDNLTIFLRQNTIRNSTHRLLVSQYYHLKSDDLTDLYERLKINSHIRDLIFYPSTHGRKIYSYTILDTDLVEDVVRFATFTMSKTKNPDVYNLVTLSGTKVDIALIPDIATSKMCREWFRKTKSIEVKCKYDADKEKWIPYELAEEGDDNDNDGDDTDGSE